MKSFTIILLLSAFALGCAHATFTISVTALSSPSAFSSPISVPLGSFATDAPIAVADFNGITYLAFKQAAGSNIFLQSTQNILDNSSWSNPIYIPGSLTGFAPALYVFQGALWMSYADSTGQVYVTSSSSPANSGTWSPPFSLTGLSNGLLYFYNAPGFVQKEENLLCVQGSLKNVGGVLGWVCLDSSNQTAHWISAVYQGVTTSYNQWFSAQFQGLTYSVFLGTAGSNIDYIISDSIGALLFPNNAQWGTIQTTSGAAIPVVVWQKLLFVGYRGSTNCYFQQSADGLKWTAYVSLPGGQVCHTSPALLVQGDQLYYFSLA